jgi:hypothetical protein
MKIFLVILTSILTIVMTASCQPFGGKEKEPKELSVANEAPFILKGVSDLTKYPS